MAKAYFMTGTDTNVGKTRVACALLAAARKQGYSTAALKPVAAGVSDTDLGRCNADVAALAQHCSPGINLNEINPVCFDDPIAPHIAAERTGTALRVIDLARQCRPVLDRQADVTLVEGAGGWKVPLNNEESLADLAIALKLPVILVVGMRLGCLNHALLTAQSIIADGAILAGWVANRIDPDMQCYTENLAALKARLPTPLLAQLPHLQYGDDGAGYFNLDAIL